jgi:hypothetical protein
MGYVCKTKLEKAWIVTSVLMLAAHRMLQVSAPDVYIAAQPLRVWLEVAIFVSSFPLGVLTAYVAQDAMFWCDGCWELSWMLDWSTLLFAGYIQWFWVLPEFLHGDKLTLLDLKRPPETVSPHVPPTDAGASHAPLPAATPVPLTAATTTAPLAATTTATLTAATPAALAVAPPPARAAARAAATPRAFDAAAFCPPAPAEFDEAGLTALDRVLQAHSTPAVPPPASQAETIFPRVS